MAYKLVILEEAKKEYRAIVDYLAAVLKSPQAAQSFVSEFDKQVALIRDNPQIFALSRLQELAAKNYRVAYVNNYVLLYTLRGTTVFIAHVCHQRQDYARLVTDGLS